MWLTIKSVKDKDWAFITWFPAICVVYFYYSCDVSSISFPLFLFESLDDTASLDLRYLDMSVCHSQEKSTME